MVLSNEENFQSLCFNSQEKFLDELRQELFYFLRTKIITLLDTYRIQTRLIPLLNVWLSSKELSYESLLKLQENLLFHALQCEEDLSDITQMVNENKYVLRSGIKAFIRTLPE